ncbi:MAG: hypothetical protein ACRDF0_10850, partial [Candidatus Limnocylindria bacterium]
VHVLHNLGVTFFQRAEFATALEYFERAELEGSDVADQKWLASLFAGMGMSRHEVGDFEGAIHYLRKSEALFEAIRNRIRAAEIHFHTGRVLRAIGNRAKADSVLTESEAAARSAGNDVLAIRIGVFLCVCRAEDGQFEIALRRLEELVIAADEIDDVSVRYTARLGLARVLRQRDAGRAEAVLREAAAMLEAVTDGRPLADVYRELSEVLAQRGLAEEALEYSNRAYAALRQS